jgi:hypothetical protein
MRVKTVVTAMGQLMRIKQKWQRLFHAVTIRNFMERKSFITEQKIMQIYRLKEKFEKERRSKSKQTTLTNLFKRAVASSNPSLFADSVTRNPDNK